MNTRDGFDLPETEMLHVNRLCNEFEAAWRAGRQPRVENALGELAGPARQAAMRELVTLEIEYRRHAAQTLVLDDYTARFPGLDRLWLAQLLDAPPALPEKLGDYKIIGRVASGGMGTVYQAVHERMGRVVALKVLRPEKQRDPDWLRRFDREVRAAARLSHPNIVAALDAREHDGVHFLITEFVDGIDLEQWVQREGPLTADVAIDCITQAARGLEYAHGQGVVHRDIKPANLLRDRGGTVKVLDMGLARLDIPEDPSPTDLTRSGMVMGTAAYMAPEQARDTRRADGRSDIYSLGCTLYYLLTGRPMYSAATVVDTILSHVSQPAPSLAEAAPAAPAALEAVFRRMVAKAPQERYQSAAELIAALQTLPSGMVKSSRSMLPVGAIVALLIASVIVIVASLYRSRGATGDRYWLEFNGRSSYVAVPELAPTAGADYTIEAICQPRAFRTSNVVTWLGPDWMAIFLSDGKWGLARRFADASHLVQATEPALLNQRVHVAGVFRGAELSLFIDGRRIPTVPNEFGLPDTSGGLHIGGVALDRLPAEQNDRFFDGAIAAVHITRGSRYRGDFTPPAAFDRDADTIALFPLEEGQGTQTRSSDKPPWIGQIVDGQWRSDPARSMAR